MKNKHNTRSHTTTTPTLDKARKCNLRDTYTAGWIKTLGKKVKPGASYGQATVGLPGIPINYR